LEEKTWGGIFKESRRQITKRRKKRKQTTRRGKREKITGFAKGKCLSASDLEKGSGGGVPAKENTEPHNPGRKKRQKKSAKRKKTEGITVQTPNNLTNKVGKEIRRAIDFLEMRNRTGVGREKNKKRPWKEGGKIHTQAQPQIAKIK